MAGERRNAQEYDNISPRINNILLQHTIRFSKPAVPCNQRGLAFSSTSSPTGRRILDTADRNVLIFGSTMGEHLLR
jgi:hypothetical protein